jgi:multisubunit Na+/H+ antiporter MnhF subunit
MVGIALEIAMGFLAASLAVCLIRLLKGPSLADRLLAAETAVLLVVALAAILSVQSSLEFFVAVPVVTALGIISSVAVVKYLVRGGPF